MMMMMVMMMMMMTRMKNNNNNNHKPQHNNKYVKLHVILYFFFSLFFFNHVPNNPLPPTLPNLTLPLLLLLLLLSLHRLFKSLQRWVEVRQRSKQCESLVHCGEATTHTIDSLPPPSPLSFFPLFTPPPSIHPSIHLSIT